MDKSNSFEKFLEECCPSTISRCLTQYAYENIKKINLVNSPIIQPNYVKLYKYSVRCVSFQEKLEKHVKFRALIKAHFIVSGWSYSIYEHDMVRLLFDVSFDGTLDNGSISLSITDVTKFDPPEDMMDCISLGSDYEGYLIPRINVDDLDKQAEVFLQRYCPKALTTPMAISVQDIVNAMGLTVYYAPLPKGTFGRTYFRNATVNVFDKNGNLVSKNINEGTILVSNDELLTKNKGFSSNTIIHECLHRELHRNQFEIKKLLSPEIDSISCAKNQKNKKALPEEVRIMEWQASSISPRILIPARTGREKLIELMQPIQHFPASCEKSALVKSVISKFADFFNVSIAVAKIRAEQLGFDEAAGVFNYVDGHYIEPFCTKNEDTTSKYIYTISHKSFIHQYENNAKFAKLCQTGLFIHVGGMLVINHPKYVHIVEGSKAKLTKYALEHVDECCISFKGKTCANKDCNEQYYDDFLSRAVDPTAFIECKYSPNYADNEDVVKRAAALAQISGEAERLKKISSTLPAHFANTLDFHIKRREYTNEEMENRTYITNRRIRELRSKDNVKVDLKTVLALCIGLNLHPVFTYDLIAKAGYNIMTCSNENLMYKYLIDNHHMENIDSWDEILLMCGFKPISKKNK